MCKPISRWFRKIFRELGNSKILYVFDHITIKIGFNFIFQGDVECFYDAESQVIYLHLRSLSDVHRVAALCQRLVSEKSSKVGVADWYWYYVKYYVVHVCIFTLLLLFKIFYLTMQLMIWFFLQDFFFIWQKEEYRVAKTLLWMFGVSHLLLVIW